MRLNHNLASLNIYRNQVKNERTQGIALGNISSGNKVNNAKDNPNSLAQSERMRMQIRGLQMASRNVQDGISMLQSADGSLDSVTSMLQRIKELTIQAGGATSAEDKKVIQLEIEQMVQGIDQTVNNNEFNGVNLLKDGSVIDNNEPKVINMPGGANVDEKVQLPKYNLTSDMLGGNTPEKKLMNINITTEEGMINAIGIADTAIDTVLSVRSKYGALQNRFESLYENLGSIETSIQRAESSLRDADIAYEMMQFAKSNILIEAGNAMMAQSNNFPKEILRILENVK